MEEGVIANHGVSWKKGTIPRFGSTWFGWRPMQAYRCVNCGVVELKTREK